MAMVDKRGLKRASFEIVSVTMEGQTTTKSQEEQPQHAVKP